MRRVLADESATRKQQRKDGGRKQPTAMPRRIRRPAGGLVRGRVQPKPIEPPMMPSSMPMKKPPKFEAMNDSTASSTPAIA